MSKPLNKATKRLGIRKLSMPKGKGFTEPGSLNSHKTQPLTTRPRQFRRKKKH